MLPPAWVSRRSSFWSAARVREGCRPQQPQKDSSSLCMYLTSCVGNLMQSSMDYAHNSLRNHYACIVQQVLCSIYMHEFTWIWFLSSFFPFLDSFICLLGYMTNRCTSLHWIHCTRVSTLKIQPKGKNPELALHQESLNLTPLLGGSWSNYFEELLYDYVSYMWFVSQL